MNMLTNDEISAIFAEAGADHDYENVSAEFTDFIDPKVRWVREGNDIEFRISDYFQKAPKEVLEDLAMTMFDRIDRRNDTSYSRRMIDYLTSRSFIEEYQPVYVSRLPFITASPVGKHFDLRDSKNRLIEKGLIRDIPNLFLSWMRVQSYEHAGRASVLMRTASINCNLDSKLVSNDLMDYVMYSQLVFIQNGFHPSPRDSIKGMVDSIKEYPDYKRYDDMLVEMGYRSMIEMFPEC